MTIKFFRTLIFATLTFIENSKLYIDNGKTAILPKVKLSGSNKITVTVGDEIFDITISKRKGKNVRRA